MKHLIFLFSMLIGCAVAQPLNENTSTKEQKQIVSVQLTLERNGTIVGAPSIVAALGDDVEMTSQNETYGYRLKLKVSKIEKYNEKNIAWLHIQAHELVNSKWTLLGEPNIGGFIGESAGAELIDADQSSFKVTAVISYADAEQVKKFEKCTKKDDSSAVQTFFNVPNKQQCGACTSGKTICCTNGCCSDSINGCPTICSN